MDVLRLAAEPPDQQTFAQRKPTLVVSWWSTFFSITIILFRICGRYVRTEKIFSEDGVMLLAIIPLVVRMAFIHVVLLFGTNNTVTSSLTSEDIRQREIGSRMVLVSRVMYAAYLWAIKYSVSMFLQTLTGPVWQRFHQKILRYFHILLVITFIGTVISDLLQCHPFSHYWQVVPDPGPQCRQGYAYLFTMGILNIITNLILILFPIPIILKSRVSRKRKVTIILRMALPTINIAFTLYQIPTVIFHLGYQQYRTLLASFDILLTTITSNASVLDSLLQDRGYKKSKYRYDVSAPVSTHTRTVPKREERPWRSDEELGRVGNGVVIGMEPLSQSHVDKGGLLKVPDMARVKEDGIRVDTRWEVATVERANDEIGKI